MAKILAADIGGTNSRFALFEARDNDLEMVDAIWLETHGAATFSELLEQLWDSRFKAAPGGFDSAVLAVAGAVERGLVCEHLPNAPWSVDLRTVDFGLGKGRACLINDFAAQAYACRTHAVDDALVIQAGEADPDAAIAVIGAGTGLGYSALLPVNGIWSALPSEGGHMAFPFTGPEEAEYGEFNRRESGRCWAEGDSVVTGLGLQLVHKYLTGEEKTPREISESVTADSETVKWYARFYGRACRNWGRRPDVFWRAVHCRRRGRQKFVVCRIARISERISQHACLFRLSAFHPGQAQRQPGERVVRSGILRGAAPGHRRGERA